MKYEVNGTVLQTVSIDLSRGERLYSISNSMAWMSDSIRMSTNTGGGFWAGIARSLGGGSFFITEFLAREDANITFAPRFPGTIMPLTLAQGESIVCRREAFLCAEQSVALEIAWQKRMGAGFFAGQGFILQRMTGPGTVWLDLSGELIEKDLKAGEKLFVHAGHIGAQDPSVSIDIEMVKGFTNMLFGGQGLFLATLTGPGRVWLQSMPIMNLAEEIARYMPGPGSERSGVAATGIAAGVLGALLGGRKNDSST